MAVRRARSRGELRARPKGEASGRAFPPLWWDGCLVEAMGAKLESRMERWRG